MTAEILEKIGSYNKNFNRNRVKQAFDFVAEKYPDTDSNVNYPMEVLEVLLPLKPDEDTIVAVLLHDLYVISFLNDEKIRDLFGQQVLDILQALKRLSTLNYGESDKVSQMEILRKMFLTMAKDIRVILIWLAQRLCKMQNLDSSDELAGTKLRIAQETMNIYVPIASRLGIYRMKTQLEDFAFKYLHPEEYSDLNSQVQSFGRSRKFAIEYIKQDLERFLRSKGVEAEVFGRLKSIYSIYVKLNKKGLKQLDDIYDFFAMRIVLPAKKTELGAEMIDNLYMVLGLIHSEWRPVSSRFKDYIAVPKPNGYRSLHTVVLGLAPKDMEQPVEIQIRDSDMHREAEYGIASHWLYKSKNSLTMQNLDSQVDWVRGLEKIHEFFDSDSEMIKEVELDIFKDRIFVLTPRGEVKDLPLGSVPIDFAYAVHTDVGHKCIAAKVNGSVVPLSYELKNGDVVEVVTRKDAAPKLKWLSMVKSNFAKHKIKSWFSGLNRENNLKEGRRLLNSQLERLKKPLLDQHYSILKHYSDNVLDQSQRESLVEEVGRGTKIAADVVRKIYPYEKNLSPSEAPNISIPELEMRKKMESAVLEDQVIVGGESGLPIKIASCCLPKIGDKIMAYVTRGSRITVHKSNCRLLDTLDGERIIFANWKGLDLAEGAAKYKVRIKLTVVSRLGLIHDITSVISDLGMNILDVMIKKSGGGFYNDFFLLEMDDLDKFDVLLDRLENIQGVTKVSREDKVK